MPEKINIIGSKIRALREDRQISAKDMAGLLTDRGFPTKYPTYMGYESGNSMPNADMFLAICDILQVSDILHTFGYGSDMYPSFDSKQLRNNPYFRLVDEYCYATQQDSKPVFEYFFSPNHKGNPMYIFSKKIPNLPDQIAVANLLGLYNHATLLNWGIENGYWNKESEKPKGYSDLDSDDKLLADGFVDGLLTKPKYKSVSSTG